MRMKPYVTLLITSCMSFVVMYAVMYLNVYSTAHIYISTTRLYMALLMVLPMSIIMITMMRAMYTHKKLNTVIITGAGLLFITVLILLRTQVGVDDKQYMRAMIPHHSSAILTSMNAHIEDPEVKELSRNIIETQEREIAQMKAILKRMD